MDKIQNPVMRFFEAMDRVRRIWHDTTPCEGLSKSQFFTLLTLSHGGKDPRNQHKQIDPFQPMTITVLAGAMRQSLPAVSQRIARLEELGYVVREQDERDKRTIWVRLTPAGQELLDEGWRGMIRWTETWMSSIGEENMEAMVQNLSRLADAMEAASRSGSKHD